MFVISYKSLKFEILGKLIHLLTDGFRRPCRDFSPECLRRSLQAILPVFVDGIPELGVPSLDPYKVENLHFDLPGGISLEIKEGYTKGLRKCHVDSVRYVLFININPIS